jgi:hypothetical protein
MCVFVTAEQRNIKKIPEQIVLDLLWIKLHWAGFLRVIRFPLPILIPSTARHSQIILSATLHSLENDSVVK